MVDLRPEEERPIKYDPNFKGPLKKRSCTDIIFMILFIVFCAVWAAIGIFAIIRGNPDLLLVPKDSYGARCGIDSHVKDKPYLFFFNLSECLNPNVPFTGCPTKQVCVEECPNEYFNWENSKDVKKLICDYGVSENEKTGDNMKCAKWYLPSSSFEKRCVPILNRTLIDKVSGEVDSESSKIISAIKNVKFLSEAEQVGEKVVDDIITSRWKILAGLVIAAVASIIFIMILRWIASIMVWLSLLGVIALLSAGTYFSVKKYIDLRDNPETDKTNDNVWESYTRKKDFWLVLAIIAAVLLALILLITIFLRKRIILAVALVREGSKAVSSVSSVLFFPILPWVLHLGVIAYAICVALYLATSGTPIYQIRNMKEGCCEGLASYFKNGISCDPEEFMKMFRDNCHLTPACQTTTCKFIGTDTPKGYGWLHAYNVVGFIWVSFFITGLGQMILAHVFATWYWTWDKSKLPFFTVTEAILRILRYHIGTVAFGSLIITICRIIRIMLEYIDHKLKKYDNGLTKAILCCCKCFFWCLERFLKFINKNAFIMCAVHGKNFCTSARDAFNLLFRNIIRVFVLDKVTDFLFFLGKLLITIGVGAISYLLFATDLTFVDNSGLNYDFVPVIIIMIGTYIIASIFFSVYSMAVDTLFLCFLEDSERNDGSANRPYFMSRSLMQILGKKNKFD